MVQRQPRHHHVGLEVELGRLGDGVEVGAEDPVGEHHALGLAGRAARVLQDDQALGVGRRAARAADALGVAAAGLHRAERRHRRVARRRARRTAPARRRSAGAWRRRGGCGPGSRCTNSSIEPIRIGSGSTIEAAPASQHALDGGDSARLVGPRMATWSPGAMPRAWRVAPTAGASSWSCAHGTVTRRRTVDEGDRLAGAIGGALEAGGEWAGASAADGTWAGKWWLGPVKQKVGFTVMPGTESPPPGADTPEAPLHGVAGRRDRGALAGPLGARGHVRGAQPGRPPGRAGQGRPAGRSCSCSTCSRTRRAPGCTSATRSASSAPTSTAATSA